MFALPAPLRYALRAGLVPAPQKARTAAWREGLVRCYCFALLMGLSLAAWDVSAEVSAVPDTSPAEITLAPEEDRRLRWYIFVGAVNAYPLMKTEKLIRNIYDPVMKAIAPGRDDANTVGDLRDDHILLPPQMGIGVQLSRRFTLSIQGGYASGLVRTDQDNPSIFFGIPWHEDFQIRRGAGYLGAGLDFYPFGTCEQHTYKGFVERIKGIRPFMGSSVTVTRATYDARVQIGLKGLPNIGIKLDDKWVLPSLNVHAGLDFPVNNRSAISVNTGYNHFWEQEQDFEGWAISMTYKYLFH